MIRLTAIFFFKVISHLTLYKASLFMYILQFIVSSCKYFEESSDSKIIVQ